MLLAVNMTTMGWNKGKILTHKKVFEWVLTGGIFQMQMLAMNGTIHGITKYY
jgi:hypothetical protein